MWLTFTKGKCCSKNWVVFFSGNYLPIPTTWPLVCNWWPPVQIQLSVSEPLLPCILLPLPQVVPDAEHGRAHHLPAGVLCVARGEEVVGAVLQAALARHHRHLPQGAGAGPPRTQEGHRQAGQADRDEVRGGVVWQTDTLATAGTVSSPTFSASGDSHQDWKNDFLTWRSSLSAISTHIYIAAL